MRWRMVPKAALALILCLVVFLWVRWAHVTLPGQPTEWHLRENLIFWSRLTSWTSRDDFYSLGIALPRMTYLIFAVGSLAFGWYKGTSPLLLTATFAFVILAALLLCMGFEDEFRNLSLSLPLLVLIWAERSQKGTVPVAVSQPLGMSQIQFKKAQNGITAGPASTPTPVGLKLLVCDSL